MKTAMDAILNDEDLTFVYSTDESKIKKGQLGNTSPDEEDSKRININFKKGNLAGCLHESRHGWGAILGEWSSAGGYDTKDEIMAFSWQKELDAKSVNDFIENVAKTFYPDKPDVQRSMELEEAINLWYDKYNPFFQISTKQIMAPGIK